MSRNKKQQIARNKLGINEIKTYIYENINNYNVFFNIDIIPNVWLTASINKTEKYSYQVLDPNKNKTEIIVSLIKDTKSYHLKIYIDDVIYKIHCPFKSMKKYSEKKWIAKGTWLKHINTKKLPVINSKQYFDKLYNNNK